METYDWLYVEKMISGMITKAYTDMYTVAILSFLTDSVEYLYLCVSCYIFPFLASSTHHHCRLMFFKQALSKFHFLFSFSFSFVFPLSFYFSFSFWLSYTFFKDVDTLHFIVSRGGVCNCCRSYGNFRHWKRSCWSVVHQWDGHQGGDDLAGRQGKLCVPGGVPWHITGGQPELSSV